MYRKTKQLQLQVPERYPDKSIMKDRLFYGMRIDLKRPLKYLFDHPETTYANLLAAAHVAEVEYHKKVVVLHSKGVIEVPSPDVPPGSPVLAVMENKIDTLTSIVKGVHYKKGKGVAAHSKQVRDMTAQESSNQAQTQKSSKLAKKGFAGHCWKCVGWGHRMCECPSQGNGQWGEASRRPNPPDPNPNLPAQK